MTELSRRGFVASTGGAIAAAWLLADADKLRAAAEYAAGVAHRTPPPPFEFLTPEQAADLDAASAQIIPSDDTPGAHEARVVYFIDKSLATWAKEQQPAFTEGLSELTKRAAAASSAAGAVAAGSPGGAAASVPSFASLTREQQQAVIASLEKDKHQFFFALRGATIVGMFANPEYGGNFEKSGWKLIGFDDRFSWAPPFGWYDANA